ncbi:P-loop containing nucleoside triphosphate hydrolase protein [Mycena sp. CBHHK59/15]|nr:P-loop containing nucleoside triphosphate hydrolase protein [Mycena sp. CBHHK59/15]
MKLENARYQNRVRRSDQTSVILTDSRGREFTGRAQGANGRLTDISFNKKQFSGNLTAVRVVGREEATCAEKARDEFVLRALLGEVRLAESCFVGFLWFPETQQLMATGTSDTEGCAPPNLNASQRHALSRMTSTTPLVIIQGPPGTGKTKTIAAAAAVWEAQMRPVWIVAQSNVAVKNIAEKLFKEGINFKVLVSKEFYFEWHEHIYSVVADNLIRTDEFAKDHRGMGFMLGGARVILCTLSALSNPVLDQVGMFLHVPVERLIVDEASQINIFEFMVRCSSPLVNVPL